MIDITLLTDARYVNPKKVDWYIQNILDEDALVTAALQKRGLSVARTHWDNPVFDWSSTRYAVFRTTWDYFDRFAEFSNWLNQTEKLTRFINPVQQIRWNLDKHYLLDLQRQGIAIPPTYMVEAGDTRPLAEIIRNTSWKEWILKPAVSGAARHTYRFTHASVATLEDVFTGLIANEAMLLQEFQQPVLTHGEVAYMVFGGTFTHAILKRSKPGDFRVQDDFGGTIHDYQATSAEIAFAEHVVSTCNPVPVYARVDVIRNNQNELCVSELELIEPELWFRKHHAAADAFADAVVAYMQADRARP
jgi:hypothetical protein